MLRRAIATLLVCCFLAGAFLLPVAAQTGKPDNCYPTNVAGYQEYWSPEVRRAWDSYSYDSAGLCRYDNTMGAPQPGPCSYAVQIGTATHGQTGYLCWYGEPPQHLQTSLDPAGVRDVIERVLTMDAVQRLLGPGRHVIVLQVGADTFTIVTEGTSLVSIDGRLFPPANCTPTPLSGFPESTDPATKAVWDSNSANTLAVCRVDPPNSPPSECVYKHALASPMLPAGTWLCWWGATLRVQQVQENDLQESLRILMSPDAFRALLNSGGDFYVFQQLVLRELIAFHAANPWKQAAINALLKRTMEDIEAEPPRPLIESVLNDLGAPMGYPTTLKVEGGEKYDIRSIAGLTLDLSDLDEDEEDDDGTYDDGIILVRPGDFGPFTGAWGFMAQNFFGDLSLDGEIRSLPPPSYGPTIDTIPDFGPSPEFFEEWRTGSPQERAWLWGDLPETWVSEMDEVM